MLRFHAGTLIPIEPSGNNFVALFIAPGLTTTRRQAAFVFSNQTKLHFRGPGMIPVPYS
jgi:hypothetical protein